MSNVNENYGTYFGQGLVDAFCKDYEIMFADWGSYTRQKLNELEACRVEEALVDIKSAPQKMLSKVRRCFSRSVATPT